MKTTLPISLVLGLTLGWAQTEQISLSQTTSNLNASVQMFEKASVALQEIADSRMPVDLSGSYVIPVDHQLEAKSLIKIGTVGSSEKVPLVSLTNLVIKTTGTNLVEMSFIRPALGQSLENTVASLDRRGLRLAEPTELCAFSRYFTNLTGQFWIELPVGAPIQKPFPHQAAMSLINEDKRRVLSYNSVSLVLHAPYFWLACVKK